MVCFMQAWLSQVNRTKENYFLSLQLSLLLLSAKLPVVTIDEDTEEIVASNTDTFQLKLHNSAVSTTIALFDKYVVPFL